MPNVASRLRRGLGFASLGSGSRGNCALVEAGGTCLMIDNGFSVSQSEKRLARLGRTPADIDALLVTHEHSDHVGGVARFARRHQVPVWMTPGTHAAVGELPGVTVQHINCHEAFVIGDMQIQPFPVPHDAREPCQFVFSDGAHCIGVLTDTGTVTPHIVSTLGSCDALALECNHDTALLSRSPYPASIRARVGGRLGHLNNDQAAALLAQLDHRRLHWVVGVHLSEKNNTPELARDALASATGASPEDFVVACQNDGLDWRSVGG